MAHNFTGEFLSKNDSNNVKVLQKCLQNGTGDFGAERNCSLNSVIDYFQPANLTLHIVFILMDLLNVTGCVVVITLIYKATKFKDTPGKLLLNHTIADGYIGFSYLLMNIPIFTVTDKSFMQKLHLAHRILLSITGGESMYTLAMVLFTLHLAICNPITYKLHCRSVYVLVYLILSWTLNSLFNCSVFLVENIDGTETSSQIIWLYLKENFLVFGFLHMVMTHNVPFIIIMACYIRIILFARRQANAEIYNQSATKTYIKQARGVMFISVTFFLTQLPMYAFEILSRAFAKSAAEDRLLFLVMLFTIISYLYLALKLPLLLYGFKSYRRVFLQMFCCCRRKPKMSGIRAREKSAPKHQDHNVAIETLNSSLASRSTDNPEVEISRGSSLPSSE